VICIKITLRQIFNDLTDRVNTYTPEHKKFKWYAYSDYKAKFYIYVSAPLIYIFLKLKIKPNVITLAYIILGLLGGILLSVNNKSCIYGAVAILFLRPILDWCDGMVAHYIDMQSPEGHCLDIYGAYSGWIALWTGLGFYAYHKTGMNFIVYTVPLAPFMYILDIRSFFRSVIFDPDAAAADHEEFINKNLQPAINKNNLTIAAEQSLPNNRAGNFNINNLICRAMNRISIIFFEHKARTVDCICLLILIELNSKLSVIWIYYLAFLVFQGLYLLITYVNFLKGKYVKRVFACVADLILRNK